MSWLIFIHIYILEYKYRTNDCRDTLKLLWCVYRCWKLSSDYYMKHYCIHEYIYINTLYVGNLSTTWTEITHFGDVLPRSIPLWEPELLPLPLLPWVRMSPSLSRVRSAEYLLYCSTGVPALPSARLSRLAAKDAGALIWPLPTSFRYYQNTKSKIDLLHQEIYAAL